MKTFITFLLLTFTMSIQAQKPLDTIYANDQKNVALFFPKPIRQGITGASHFVFTYNRETEQYVGLLQAQPGTDSNLLAVTSDGKVYSYILKYSDKLPKLNYLINENESIGDESPTMEILKTENPATATNKDRTAYFQRASEYLLRSGSETIAVKRKKGIRLKLQKMVYDASEVHLVMEVKNKSGIDFEIDYLNVYRTNGNNKRKASYQRLKQKVIYKHKMPHCIIDGQSRRFVYVLPKFVLGDNEKLMLELKELNGSRKVVLQTNL